MYWVLYFTPLTLTQSHPIRSLDLINLFFPLDFVYSTIYRKKISLKYLIFTSLLIHTTYDTLIFSVWFFAINLVSPLFDFEHTQFSHQNATVHSFSFIFITHTSWQLSISRLCLSWSIIHCCLSFFGDFLSSKILTCDYIFHFSTSAYSPAALDRSDRRVVNYHRRALSTSKDKFSDFRIIRRSWLWFHRIHSTLWLAECSLS